MPDEPSRLLGLAGLRVTRVLVTESDALDLEVEGVGPAGRCRHCGCEDLVVKERPVVGVRDLPLAGRVARILWRKRRWRCRGCGRSHTEQHPALPSRQRVSGRFREQLVARAAGGGAHAEIAREEATSRYQVAPRPGARGADARRGGSAALARRGPPPARPRACHCGVRPRSQARLAAGEKNKPARSLVFGLARPSR